MWRSRLVIGCPRRWCGSWRLWSSWWGCRGTGRQARSAGGAECCCAAAVIAGYILEFTFGALGLIPDQAAATIPTEGISWNYTTFLNIAFLLLAVAFLIRFLRTGGRQMLAMMGGAPGSEEHGGEGRHDG